MSIVVYTDPDDGYKRVVEVPNGLVDEAMYQYGAFLGPPDLSQINLSNEDTRILNNALCDLKIYNMVQMSGRRHEIMGVIKTQLGITDSRVASDILRSVVAVYQQDLLEL